MQSKILIVDDEPDIVGLLQDYFEINDYQVITAVNGTEAMRKVEKQPDLIILDINMPDMNGLEVCQRIREFVPCPIFFLTAKVEESDKINGFQAGGDDYIEKPFSIDELGARVEAHLRRENRNQVKTKTKFDKNLVIDYLERGVYYCDEPICFAKKEFDIVALLLMNRGQVFDKERIYERLWGWESDGDSSVVVEHIRRIRGKFTAAGSPQYIETVWGVGYKWVK